MNTKNLITVASVLLCLPFLLAFIKKDQNQKKLPKVFRDRFEYIPRQSHTLEAEFQESFVSDDSKLNQTVSVKHFYCANKEVSNIEYREFLNSVKEEGKEELYKLAEIDSLRWVKKNNR